MPAQKELVAVSSALDVGSLLAFRALHHFERDFFAFFQGLETIHVDGREMCEKVFAAVIRRNEAKAFRIVEPFDRTDCHDVLISYKKRTNCRVAPSPCLIPTSLHLAH